MDSCRKYSMNCARMYFDVCSELKFEGGLGCTALGPSDPRCTQSSTRYLMTDPGVDYSWSKPVS